MEEMIPQAIEICAGCLSVDRKMSNVKDSRKLVLLRLLDPMICRQSTILLCWECSALVEKSMKFQERVQRASQIISDFMMYGSKPVQSLTTLCCTAVASSVISLHHEVQETEPIFIKMEEDAYHDTPCGDDVKTDDDDDDDVKATAITNNIDLEKHNDKHFDDSDDEPLALKPKAREDVVNDHAPNKRKKKKKRREDSEKEHSKRNSKSEQVPAVGNKKARRKLEQLNMEPGLISLVYLTSEEIEEERRRIASSDVYAQLEHKCSLCVVGFNYRVKLDNHMKKHDAAAGPEQCAICRVRFKDERALLAHVRRHRVRWRCAVCGWAGSRAAVVADHVTREHGAPSPTHTCALCGHVASSLGRLRVHLRVHGARQECPECGKTFRDRAALRSHLFIHSGTKEYSCPNCDKQFLFKKAMQIHLVTHLQPQHLYCHECDVTFKNRMSYYGHMKYNLRHIDPAKLKYGCEWCDKKFSKASRLQEHRAAIHLKVTPVRCDQPDCRFACASRAVLRAHVRSTHRAARSRPHHLVCHRCGRRLTSKKALERHLRSCAGTARSGSERPG